MRLLLLVFALAPLWAQDPTESRNQLNQGVQAFRSGNYAEAVQGFQRAVDLDPSFVIARLYLATAYMQQYIPGADSPENNQMATRAQEAFLQVLAVEPNNAVAMGSIASISLNQRRWADARGWYEKMIALDPRNADAYYSLGYIAWSEWYPSYLQARKNLGMKQEDPGPIPSLSVREDLRARFGSILAVGIANLQKALEVNPRYDDAMAYMNLLIRERADLSDTPEEWRKDVAVADQWVQKALDTKKMKAEAQSSAQAGTVPSRIRVAAAVEEQKLIRRVEPVYPPLGVQARVQGIVRLSLNLSKEGTVQDVTVLSGHPLLIPAALEAVKQWIYQPTLLNGAPVEVTTEAEVRFTLDR